MSERIEEINRALTEATHGELGVLSVVDGFAIVSGYETIARKIKRREDAELFAKAHGYISYLLKELETKDFTIRSLEHNRALLSKELEEAQQRSTKWEKAFDNADKQYLKMEHEAAELRRQLANKSEKLAEAQQTITQLQDVVQQVKAHTSPGWQSDYKTAKDALYHINQLVEGRE